MGNEDGQHEHESQVGNQTSARSPLITRAELLNALSQEVAAIESANQRAGWTHWALVGALASLVWLFLNELKGSPFTLPNVAYCLICILLISDLFTQSDESGLPLNRNAKENRFKPMGFYSHKKRILIYQFVRLICLYCLAIVFAKLTATSIPFTLHIYCAFLAFALICAFFLIEFNVAILSTQHTASKSQQAVGVISVVVWGVTLFLYVAKIDASTASALAVVDIKFALMIFASLELIRLICSHSIPPLYFSLIEIKRDLLFGRIKVEEAAAQMEVAVLGLKFEDLFQNDIREILSMVEEDCRVTERVQKVVINCLKLSKKAQDLVVLKEYSEEQFNHFSNALKASNDYSAQCSAEELIEGYAKRASFRIATINTIHAKLQLKATIVLSNNPHLKSEFASLNKQIIEGVQRLLEARKQLQSYVNQLKSSTVLIQEAAKNMVHAAQARVELEKVKGVQSK